MVYRFLVLLVLLLAAALPAYSPPTARLVFAGDLMLGRGVAEAHAADGSEAAALAELAPLLQSADLALGNLESPLTAQPLQNINGSGDLPGYDLRAAPARAALLFNAGFDLLSLANNHSLDAGFVGLQETRAALRRNGMTPLGTEAGPVFREVNGLRLAFLAFEDVTAPLDLAVVKRAVSRARQTGASVIVSIHWGGEYRAAPDARQRAVAQVLADAGADVVWGHHPHVLQPVVWLHGEERMRPTLVAYSLGNALFDQIVSPDARRSAALSVELDRNGVRTVTAHPFLIHPLDGCVLVLTAEETSAGPCRAPASELAPGLEGARILSRLGLIAIAP